jgi:hypothetical protein
LVSGAFHPPSGVLFSFPSPYWCAIGLGTYLVLEGDPPRFLSHIRGRVLRNQTHLSLHYSYGAITLYGGPFQVSSDRGAGRKSSPLPHIQGRFLCPVRFGLFPFHSPLLGESRLISFPQPTQMFPFGWFPFPYREYPSFRRVGPPIRESSDQRMLAPSRGLSQLAAPFFGDRAEPSTKRRIMSGSFPTATGKITHILCRCSSLLT